MNTLHHLTRETGHVRQSPRSEIDDDALQRLKPRLLQAIRTGEPAELDPSDWTIEAAVAGDRLDIQAWHGPADGEPHLRLSVEDHVLVASMAGLVNLRPTVAAQAAIEAGDLERCLAWTWIELGRPSADR